MWTWDNLFTWVGFLMFVGCMAVIFALLIGLSQGWEASTSGQWWTTASFGAAAGFLALMLGERMRR